MADTTLKEILNKEIEDGNSKDLKTTEVEPIKCSFQKMTPTKCDDINYYKQALDFAFQEEDLLNIAITGPYSSGKSSVINTYGNNSNKNIIHISLAYFNEEARSEIREQDKNSLEGKIINQLIHQIDEDKIPLTKFRVKPDINNNLLKKTTGLIIAIVVSLIFLTNFGWWKEIVNNIDNDNIKSILNFSTSSVFYILVLISFIVQLTYSIYEVVKEQFKNPILKKIKIKDGEFELFDKNENSVFNKYLDEILYILTKSEVDAIVFEDIDRYDDNEIFTKLREINFLANAKLKKDENKLRFIYLLRDDLFLSKDRTKFFDFIIPIVPVIDSSNSYNKLIKFMKEGNIFDKFDNLFIDRLCLYIDDMRLLKNIYNEFLIYSGRISVEKNQLDNNKLFAIIVYKNIFPKDFSELQLNRGYVFNVLSNKEKLIKNDIEQIEKQINEIEIKIKKINEENLNSIDELDALYLNLSYDYRTKSGKSRNEYNSFTEFIKQIKKDNYITYYNQDLKEIFGELEKNKEYMERKSDIENKYSIKLFREEISKLNNQKDKINSLKICELIKNENEEILFNVDLEENKKIINNQYYQLIKYLIREGKIDESYGDYLTYFYDDSLANEDKIFLRSITDREKRGYDYKLKNIKYLITKLDKSDFIHEEILNFDLLDYLLRTGNKFIEVFMQNIYENKKNNFIFEYMDKGNEKETFVTRLNRLYPDIIHRILNSGYLNHYYIIVYIIYTFEYLTQEEYCKMNIDNAITNYISLRNDILEIEGQTIELQIKAFKGLDVKFKTVRYDSVNKDLFNGIYINNLYEINTSMIALILEKEYGLSDKTEYWKRNYTLISSNKNEPLKKYIEDKIDEYINVMLGNSLEGVYDEEECVVNLLNNENIDNEAKLKYIELLKVNISDISMISDKNSLYEELLKKKVVKYNANNILDYYMNYSKSIDKTLIDFIESSDFNISFNVENSEYNKEQLECFFEELIINNEISISKYKMLLKESDIKIDDFNYVGIEISRVEYLINLQILRMTEQNLSFIRTNYQTLVKLFIVTNIEQYKNIIKDQLINDNEKQIVLDELVNNNISIDSDFLVELLKNDSIEKGYKKKLIYNNGRKLSKDELINCFEAANLPKYSSLFQGEISEIKENEENDNLLSLLLDKELISKYSKEDTIDNDYYRVIGKSVSR